MTIYRRLTPCPRFALSAMGTGFALSALLLTTAAYATPFHEVAAKVPEKSGVSSPYRANPSSGYCYFTQATATAIVGVPVSAGKDVNTDGQRQCSYVQPLAGGYGLALFIYSWKYPPVSPGGMTQCDKSWRTDGYPSITSTAIGCIKVGSSEIQMYIGGEAIAEVEDLKNQTEIVMQTEDEQNANTGSPLVKEPGIKARLTQAAKAATTMLEQKG